MTENYGDEEEMVLAENDWSRMKQRALTSGYREGLGRASDECNQEVFDLAYAQGFRDGLSEGEERGKMAAKLILSSDTKRNL